MSRPPQKWLLSWLVGLMLAGSSATYAATFYVSPAGNDDDPGDSQSPWGTIQTGVNRLSPGDSLVVQPGIYRESVVVTLAGTEAAPIRLAAQPGAILESPDPSRSLSALDFRPGTQYLVVEGFELRGGYHETVFVRPGVHHLTLRNLRVHGNRTGLWIAGASNIEVRGCSIEENFGTGVRVYQGASAITISDTEAVGNDDGAACAGNADGFAVEQDVTGFTCVRCRAVGNGEDGFDLAAGDIEVDQSWAIENGCAGIKLFQGGRVSNSVVARNRSGVLTTNMRAAPVTAQFNHLTVADNAGVGFLLRSPMAGFTTTPYTVELFNSIVAGSSKAVEVEADVLFSEGHNLFFRPDSTEPLIVFRRSGTTQTFSGQDINARRYASRTLLGEGTFAIDPEFAEHSAYTLSATSAAVDRGGDNLQASKDVDGRTRPFGGASDIGAQESPFTVSNHLPWPDPGPARRVIVGSWLRVSAYGSVDPDGDLLTFLWDFGDSSLPVRGFSPRHLYLDPGDYTITLLASDGRSQNSRSTQVTVEWPPSTHLQHDTALLPVRASKVVIARGREEAWRTLRLRVRNADAIGSSEPYGHLVAVVASDGTCPAGTIAQGPDFEPTLEGVQDRALVPAGRTRTARLTLRFARSAAPGCTLSVTATTVLPGNVDPVVENNQVAVPISVVDRNGSPN